MKPKDRFFHKGPYKGSFIMHVSGSLTIASNCHGQKELSLGTGSDDVDEDASSSSFGMLVLEDTPLFV